MQSKEQQLSSKEGIHLHIHRTSRKPMGLMHGEKGQNSSRKAERMLRVQITQDLVNQSMDFGVYLCVEHAIREVQGGWKQGQTYTIKEYWSCYMENRI